MGACCSKEELFEGGNEERIGLCEEHEEEDDDVRIGDGGAIVRFQGSSKSTSMFTKQGKKGINQDAMTVWENFTGAEDTLFCGVFDGHGPSGHKVARHVRDILPSKLHAMIKLLQLTGYKFNDASIDETSSLFRDLKDGFVNSFEELDKEIGRDSTIDCFCSGSTAVTIFKQRDYLIIGNLGDSRAVLGTRSKKNQLVPVQLTLDLKPNVPSETERIKNCKGRVFAMDEEPGVYRIWMPDEDCPGLAMARAFGDFCLKEYGLISTPQISYRKLTDDDEFVVLASDGVWDVLSNNEVVKIVGSAKLRSMAPKLLVNRAVRAWKTKYPSSKTDDCAVICLFLKTQPTLTKSTSEVNSGSVGRSSEFGASESCRSIKSNGGGEEALDGRSWNALDGVTRVNSIVKLPRLASVLSMKKAEAKS